MELTFVVEDGKDFLVCVSKDTNLNEEIRAKNSSKEIRIEKRDLIELF